MRPESTTLQFVAANHGFSFLHDRRWHVMVDERESLAMRMIDRGDLVAQCNVALLPKGEPGKHPTLAKFQADIEQSLDKNFKQFAEASETTNTLGYTVYRVVATGAVSELPIEWIYYRVADRDGHQVVFAFTLESELKPQLADSDQAIVDTLEFDAAALRTAGSRGQGTGDR